MALELADNSMDRNYPKPQLIVRNYLIVKEQIGKSPRSGLVQHLFYPIQNMAIDHGRFHVLVSGKPMGRSDIITILEQMSGEAMPERADRRGFTEKVKKFRFWSGPGRMARVTSNWNRRDWYGVSLWHRRSFFFVATEDYHFFFKNVKFLENILDYAADKFLRVHPGTTESEF